MNEEKPPQQVSLHPKLVRALAELEQARENLVAEIQRQLSDTTLGRDAVEPAEAYETLPDDASEDDLQRMHELLEE